jgi:hypothetical protein
MVFINANSLLRGERLKEWSENRVRRVDFDLKIARLLFPNFF